MSDPVFAYAGEIEERHLREYAALVGGQRGWFDHFVMLVYATPIGMGLFLPIKFFAPRVDSTSYLLGCLAGLAGLQALWFYLNRRTEQDWKVSLTQSAWLGPARMSLKGTALEFQKRHETVVIDLAAIRHVSVHDHVVMVWIAGAYAVFMPRNFFASAEEEASFVNVMKARLAERMPQAGT